MAAAGTQPGPEVLRRSYLGKLTQKLRDEVLVRAWLLDGPDQFARNPRTWEETARAAEMSLANRADAVAPTVPFQPQDAVRTVAGDTRPAVPPDSVEALKAEINKLKAQLSSATSSRVAGAGSDVALAPLDPALCAEKNMPVW